MSEATTEITGYESRSVQNGTLHTFTTADGKKYKTFKDDIADDAKTFLNAGLVTIEYNVEQNNRNGRVYTDSYLNGVRAVGSTNGNAPSEVLGAQVFTSPAADRLKALELVVAIAGGKEVSGDLNKAITLAEAILEWADTGESPFAADES